jgi:AraC-like DNA-binding protein
MSKSRQAQNCPKLPSPVTALAFDFVHGHIIPEHFHEEDQLVYACRGVMTVRTTEGTWVVPAQRAVWIPSRTRHSISMAGTVSMRTLYLRPRMVTHLPRNCCVINVSRLLQELILHACNFRTLSRRSKTHAHLIDFIIDQLQTVQRVGLQLQVPSDPRAARIAAILQSEPGNSVTLDEVCRQVGASKRTIERIFRQQTRLSAGKWRQQLRLMHSLKLLAAGEKITHAAMEAGYSTPSAFIAMFRKAFGVTPRRYFENSENRKA